MIGAAQLDDCAKALHVEGDGRVVGGKRPLQPMIGVTAANALFLATIPAGLMLTIFRLASSQSGRICIYPDNSNLLRVFVIAPLVTRKLFAI